MDKSRPYRYIYLLVGVLVSLIFILYYLPYSNPIRLVPYMQGRSQRYLESDRSPSRIVQLFRSNVYRLFPRARIESGGQTVWLLDLFKPLRYTHQWNDTRLNQLLYVLTTNFSDANANESIFIHLETQLNRCVVDESLEQCDSISLGSLPRGLANQPAIRNTFRENNPVYNVSNIYRKPTPVNSSTPPLECSKTAERRRNLLHDTLQHWIRFADEHQIWWTLTFGSLIGSLRDGNIIPYDTDMDIFVLESDEPKIRRLATNRSSITSGKFNLVTRPGPYCVHNPGERMNCRGEKVQSMVDTCSFCGPLARMFMEYGNYIDLFVMNLELHTNSAGDPIGVGFTYEEDHSTKLLELPIIFPLGRCHMMGLDVPCPNHPEKLLEYCYNKNWRQPYYLCNGTTGKWDSV